MRFISKIEHLIVPKGTKFTRSGKIGLLVRLESVRWLIVAELNVIFLFCVLLQAVYDRDIDGCVVRLINGPVVSGDVKLRFKSSSRVSSWFTI